MVRTHLKTPSYTPSSLVTSSGLGDPGPFLPLGESSLFHHYEVPGFKMETQVDDFHRVRSLPLGLNGCDPVKLCPSDRPKDKTTPNLLFLVRRMGSTSNGLKVG